MTTQAPWNGLEDITRIAATNHPVRGVVLGAIAHDYLVYTNQQYAAGGPDWSGWVGPSPIEKPWVFNGGAPPPGEPWPQNGSADLNVAFDLVGAQHALGMSQLWGLDMKGGLIGKVLEGGGWETAGGTALRGFACVQWNVTGDPTKAIFSKPQRILSTFQMWGVTRDCQLIHALKVAQPTNGRVATPEWDLTNWNDAPPAMAVAATMKNDNKGQVWVLDPRHRLWSCWWDGDAQAWSAWSGPASDDAPGWNNAPKLKAIAVSQHRGAIASRNRAAEGGEPDHILLGITDTDRLVATMLRGSNAHWEPWSAPNWNGCRQSVKDIAAVQQSDGCLQIWAVSGDGTLMTISQTKRGGDWGPWHVWTSPPR